MVTVNGEPGEVELYFDLYFANRGGKFKHQFFQDGTGSSSYQTSYFENIVPCLVLPSSSL